MADSLANSRETQLKELQVRDITAVHDLCMGLQKHAPVHQLMSRQYMPAELFMCSYMNYLNATASASP